MKYVKPFLVMEKEIAKESDLGRVFGDSKNYLISLFEKDAGDDLFKFLDRLIDIEYILLYNSTYSDNHRFDHVERVVLLSTVIAMQEGLDKQCLLQLLVASKYHDIGRINDAVEDNHGKRGADKLKQLYDAHYFKNDVAFKLITKNDLDIVCEAITLHSLCDRFLEKEKDHLQLYKIARMLKDADNLDRVRLGDLDINYLRTNSGKGLKDFAQKLYRRLH